MRRNRDAQTSALGKTSAPRQRARTPPPPAAFSVEIDPSRFNTSSPVLYSLCQRPSLSEFRALLYPRFSFSGRNATLPGGRAASGCRGPGGSRGRHWDCRTRRNGRSFRHREFRRSGASGHGTAAHPYCAACGTRRSGWPRSRGRGAYAARVGRARPDGTGDTSRRNLARI